MNLIRNVFGPSKDEIWSQIANEIGGEFIDAGFWGKDVLLYKHNQWEILLDTYTQSSGEQSTTYTRLRVPFINKNDFYFKIYREGYFSSIGKLFGMQDIQIGDPFFDKNFIIKGNNEFILKQFFNDINLKTLFNEQPQLSIEVKDDEGWFGQRYPSNVDVLYFQCTGVIKHKAVLKNLFELFAAILDRLVVINSASSKAPTVKVK